MGKAWAAVHDQGVMPAARRLYLTATPRIWQERPPNWEVAEGVRDPLPREMAASMDDEDVFGPVLYKLSLASAVSRGLLARYQIIVLELKDPLVTPERLMGEERRSEEVRGQRLGALQAALLHTMAQHNLQTCITFHHRTIEAQTEAYDLTRTVWSAAELTGHDPKTVKRYVQARDNGLNPFERAPRPKAIDGYLEKTEEWVDQSKAKIRADVVHDRLAKMGYPGSPRSTRRAVNAAKTAWRIGKRRTYRPWIPEPGMWLQFDWGEGPRIAGRRTWLFCAWLSWSRFRVVIPVWDFTLGTLVACLDTTLRRIGGAPTYVLTDNAKTVTVEHIAGIPVRHPQMAAAGRHYGCQVMTCVPYDPESKDGAEATVRIAKADLVPTSANLRDQYATFAELADACRLWCDRHRATGQIPADRLDIERTTLHVLPEDPAGAVRIRAKMARAVELATVLGPDPVDQALGLAAAAGRFADDDLPSILDHLAANRPAGDLVRADEAHSVQPGTGG